MLIEIEATARIGGGRDAAATALLMELEQRLGRAWLEGDRAFIEGLLADDWTVTDASGATLTRQQVLEETFSSGTRRIDTMVVDDVRVRCFGNFAVVTGRTRAAGAYRDQPVSLTLRFTDVFELRAGRWQVVASHATLVPEDTSR
jgi:ketosteroid isomerase-like protein